MEIHHSSINLSMGLMRDYLFSAYIIIIIIIIIIIVRPCVEYGAHINI